MPPNSRTTRTPTTTSRTNRTGQPRRTTDTGGVRGMSYREGQAQLRIPPGFNAVARARALDKAMRGMGTDERAIFDALWTGRQDLTKAIEREHDRRYSPRLRARLRSELSGSDLQRAMKLLSYGQLSLRDKMKEAVAGWGTDEATIFHALDRASQSEINQLKRDAKLVARLRSELNDTDWKLVQAYLRGQGKLAGKLRRAVEGWGTDEKAIWQALETAPDHEKRFVLQQPKLLNKIRRDLNASDWLRCQRMLRGKLTNVDRVEIAMKGWGTDEAALMQALRDLNQSEFQRLPKNIDLMLDRELSGKDQIEADEILHQKRLAFDADYREKWMKKELAKYGGAAMSHPGRTVLLAKPGTGMSPLAEIKAACKGMGTDDERLWQVLAGLTDDEGSFLRRFDPDGILGIMRGDLSAKDYRRAVDVLRGGPGAATSLIRNAVDGLGTDERALYDIIDRCITRGIASAVITDKDIMEAVRRDVSSAQYQIFKQALATGQFDARMRLDFATKMAGTDEELVFEICENFGKDLRAGANVAGDVDALLKKELKTRDYWQAKDLIRGEPQSEQEKLERAKELLERERGGLSTAIMDSVSYKGRSADDAWREYQATFNQAYADGNLSQEEVAKLRRDEQFSLRMTAEYREAKGKVAQWAAQIAIAIVGIAATILTAGTAGPFVAALAASLGGKLAVAAEAMVLAAALKVGITKAVEGEGYDLTSTEAMVDAAGAAVEAGMYMVGNVAAIKAMEGLSKTALAKSIGPSIQKVFGQAGSKILAGGLEGAIDGSIGGVGEGLFWALASEDTWSRDLGTFFTKVGTKTTFRAGLATVAGGGGGAFFKSIGTTFGPAVRRVFGKGAAQSADNVLAHHADELAGSPGSQKQLFDDVVTTNQRMQGIADSIADDVGVPRTATGIKGNRPGLKADDLDQDSFIAGVLEKNQRKNYKVVGEMQDMTRGRFDLDSAADADSVAKKLKDRLEESFGAENIDYKAPREFYRRHHILARDPSTGIWHEFQVGTKATTEFIEGTIVKLPGGVKLHAKPDFHVVLYDTLGNLNKADLRAKLGLPDGFADEIGFAGLEKRYNQIMLEAGQTSRAQPYPKDFDIRVKSLADDLGAACQKIEDYRKGLLQQLDLKLKDVDGPTGVHRGPRPEPEGPEVHIKGDGAGEAPKVRKTQDDPLPELRDTHQGKNEYKDFAKGKAFLTDETGKIKVDPETVGQGALGDCYLMASCAAVARSNPEQLPRIIKDNGNGTFDVTLYLREGYWGNPKPVTRTIDARLPVDAGGTPLYAKVGKSTAEGDELWTALIEKRLAQETGSYHKISGGNIGKSINLAGTSELLTGKAENTIRTMIPDDDLLQVMHRALEGKKPITADVMQLDKVPDLKARANKRNVIGNHAYAVRSVDLAKKTVSLQNPWRSRHVEELPISEFKEFYERIHIGD